MYDIAGARSQGYSDDDLVSHLSQSGKVPFDFGRAREAGYSSKEILDAIDARQQSQRTQRQAEGAQEPGRASGVVPALAQGGADVLSGTGETLKQYTPFNSAGEMLKTAADKIAPANYDRAHLVDEKGFHASSIPQVAAEAAPGAAAGIAAARLAGKKFGLPGALLGGLATYYLQNVGNRAKERAAYDTGDENAQPTLGQKAAAAIATVPEAAVGGAAATRFLPGAGRMVNVGMRGVTEAGGKLATTAALEGAAGGAQNAIAQTGRTLGTEPGFKFDPTEAANAAATGATLAPVFGGAKAARDVNTSIKYRDIDPSVARRVANDISTSAEGGADALSSTKTGFHAVNDTAKNYATDLQTSVNALKRELGARPLPGEAEGVVRRAANGRALTERDINILDNTAAGTRSGDAVVEMARKINTLARLKKTGTFKDENFVGGVGNAMEKALPVLGQPVKGAAYAGLALAGASHAGLLVPSLGALGGLAGTYGAARLLDRAMGTRSPAKSFVDRFGGPVPPGASPQLPGAFNPTGPKIGQRRPMATPWGNPAAPPPPPGNPGQPWGTPPSPNPTGPRMAQPSAAQAAYQPGPGPSGTINQPGPAPQPMLGGPRNGPSSPFPPPPGRGPIPQPAPNMPLLGRGPGAVIQQPQTPQLRLPPPARAQLPDVANRSAYEPEVRALLTAANAKAKTQRSADAWMQRMLGDNGEVNLDEPTAPAKNKTKATTETKQAKLVASALKKAKSSETAAPTAAVSAAPPPPSRPPVEPTPNATVGSVKDTGSVVVQPQKTRLTSPLAARMATQHNTEVESAKRKPVETKPQVKRDKPLSMAEQLNEDVVHEAIKGGAKSPKEILSRGGEDPEDRQSLRATLNRMISEGAVSFATTAKKEAAPTPKASPVPAAVRAKVKASPKALTMQDITPAVDAQIAAQGGISTVKISDVVKRSGVTKEALHDLLLREAKGGGVELSKSSRTTHDNAGDVNNSGINIDGSNYVQFNVKQPPTPARATVVPFKQPPAPARDQWDAVLDAVRAKSKMPSKVEDLDADSRSRMAANKDAAERGRAALAQVQKTPEVAKRAVNEDPWEIPPELRRTKETWKAQNSDTESFKRDRTKETALKREVSDHHMKWYDAGMAGKPRGGNEAEQAAWDRGAQDRSNADRVKSGHAVKEEPGGNPERTTLTQMMKMLSAEAETKAEAEGPPKSPHYKKGDAAATIKSAQEDYANSPRGKGMPPQNLAGGMKTIERIIGLKFSIGKSIEKQVSGFDVHDFTDRFVHTRSHAGGDQLREFMKNKYPGHNDVFDGLLDHDIFTTIYNKKTSADDGTAKKR